MKRSPRRRFLYQLAVRLGRPNVDVLARSLTAKQFLEWEAYARLEPFNELRADARAAQIAMMVFNMAVAVKDRKPLKDFLLDWEKAAEAEPTKTPRKQTWQEQQKIFELLALAFNAQGVNN